MVRPSVSFEFFPPKSLQASFRLWETAKALAVFDPSFVSVTYGAGGTTRKLTREAVDALRSNLNLNVAAHLTCVDATRDEIRAMARTYANSSVSEIVALRGDPPSGSSGFEAHPDGFGSSVEMIEALKQEGDFNIRVGAYPDTHPDAQNPAAGIDYLKRKFEAGADSAITQFFFEADSFFRFRDACAKAGIENPIIPGVLPIENWSKTRGFAQRCGAFISPQVKDMFETALRDDRHDLMAIAHATELCDTLLEGGVDHLHFYTLNAPTMTRDVCVALGLTPKVDLAQVA
ncbi:MAG: methylenetetrahydrofolate reductase [Pseudomonadota bacterium]